MSGRFIRPGYRPRRGCGCAWNFWSRGLRGKNLAADRASPALPGSRIPHLNEGTETGSRGLPARSNLSAIRHCSSFNCKLPSITACPNPLGENGFQGIEADRFGEEIVHAGFTATLAVFLESICRSE